MNRDWDCYHGGIILDTIIMKLILHNTNRCKVIDVVSGRTIYLIITYW